MSSKTIRLLVGVNRAQLWLLFNNGGNITKNTWFHVATLPSGVRPIDKPLIVPCQVTYNNNFTTAIATITETGHVLVMTIVDIPIGASEMAIGCNILL